MRSHHMGFGNHGDGRRRLSSRQATPACGMVSAGTDACGIQQGMDKKLVLAEFVQLSNGGNPFLAAALLVLDVAPTARNSPTFPIS